MAVRRYRRRRGRSRSRANAIKIAIFISRLRNVFAAMRPAGRIAVCSVGVAILGGLVLIIALQGDSDSPVQNSPIAMRGGTAAAAAGDPETVLSLSLPPTPTIPPTPSPTPDPTLMSGCEDSERVTELQIRLMDLGYLDVDEPTQHFGPATKYAVQLFQRQHNLQQDGIAGPQTLDMIFADNAQKYMLLQETRGTDVDNFQRQLKDLGYLSKVTGYYGTETVEAVKAFQKENGLSVDGKAGENTLDMINSDKAKQSPSLAKEARRKANINTMISVAKKMLGKKYILGNVGPNSFDCSGLVYYCLKQGGSNRRRLTAAGYSNVDDWTKITSYSGLKKGDLLFFYNNSRSKVGHVGIYIGGGEMIDASSANGKVVRRSCTTSYWKKQFVCARRPW